MAAVAHGVAGLRRVVGPLARASRPAELGQVAAKLASHGAGAHGGGSVKVAGDVEVLAHGLDGVSAPLADLDHPVGHEAGCATHIEGGNERVIITTGVRGAHIGAGVERVDVGALEPSGQVDGLVHRLDIVEFFYFVLREIVHPHAGASGAVVLGEHTMVVGTWALAGGDDHVARASGCHMTSVDAAAEERDSIGQCDDMGESS
eukprot:scaffold26957_cov59-Phaeocystis_antarctica.AAC.3